VTDGDFDAVIGEDEGGIGSGELRGGLKECRKRLSAVFLGDTHTDPSRLPLPRRLSPHFGNGLRLDFVHNGVWVGYVGYLAETGDRPLIVSGGGVKERGLTLRGKGQTNGGPNRGLSVSSVAQSLGGSKHLVSYISVFRNKLSQVM
jgi:hypothetical protein